MSRFPAPLDDFEADDLDFPTFEAPPRRQSRPDSRSQNSAPRRPNARPATGSRSTTSRPPSQRDLEEYNAAFGPDFGSDRPRPSSLSRDNSRSGSRRPKTARASPSKAPNNGARRAPSSPQNAPRRATPLVLRSVHFQICGVLLIAFGGLLGWNALQSSPDGALPRYSLLALRTAFGIGAVALPFGLLFLGVLLFTKRQNLNLRAFWRGAGTAFFTLLTASHLYVPRGGEFADRATLWGHGGYVGGALAWLLRRGLGEIGAIVALAAFAFVALLLWSENTAGETSRKLAAKWSDFVQNVRGRFDEMKHERDQNRNEKLRENEARRSSNAPNFDEEETEDWDETGDYEIEEDAPRTLPRQIVREIQTSRRASPFVAVEEVLGDTKAAAPQKSEPKEEFPSVPTPAIDPESSIDAPKFVEKTSDAPRIEILDAPPPPSVVDSIDYRAAVAGENADHELTPNEALELQAEQSAQGEIEIKAPKTELPRRSFGDGPLMPTYFDPAVRALDPPVPPDNAGAEEEIQKGVAGVQETLAAFKIDARVTDVKRGPVITRYEVQPGAGVRVASIANLDKDLARSLSALAVRIEAPVPGKNVVGIEIPNKKVNLVRMRDVLEQPDFLSHPSKLAFVLGKDIAGQPKWGDLTKMPHMLIAGSTNSGKSVCLNSIIASILVRAQPDEVRFSLIDPKRVELTLYKGIKHLMHDVVVEPKQAVIALRRAIEEMDRRYKLFASRGVRNIVSFNSKLNEGEKPMPYIVIVIDELADLMMTAAAEFEKLICRLAQLARATGIHLIVATQRPSVNVITGVIKANIPARIAFAVASQVDSRTILDSVGAERLIGSGDMLYDCNNGGKSVRIQGAFLSEEEVNRIVEVVKAAYTYEEDTPDDLPTFDLYSEDSDADFEGEKPASNEKRDALYDEIVEFVARHQEMSASLIQRKFEIGYPRAGRIVDHLERDGILGPADGPKPRKVLGANRE
jgi:S-DNA-T family DNA segregation ATPase FtsK/SpoIIIE